MKRFLFLVVTAASFALAAGVVAAEGSTRPDDRATHGPGVLGVDGARGAVRPDDRAWRGVGPAPAAVSSKARSTRPDDRATHRPGALGVDGARDAIRPDDRAWRGIGPEPTVVPIASPSTTVDSFDWVDASIGAAGMLGLVLLLAGVSAIVLRRNRVAALA